MPGQGRCDDLGWFLFAREGVHIGHQGSSQPPCPGREGVTILAGRGAQWPARIVTATMPGQGGRDDLGGKGRTVARRTVTATMPGQGGRDDLGWLPFSREGAHMIFLLYMSLSTDIHTYMYIYIYIYIYTVGGRHPFWRGYPTIYVGESKKKVFPQPTHPSARSQPDTITISG